MSQFVTIDFETANPKRVSACALGYAIVEDGAIVGNDGFLIKPVGGHAPFQTKIHGIRETHTADQPDFGSVYSSIAFLFDVPVVGHSMFDKQVLNALGDHFGLSLRFEYTDSCSLAKEALPDLRNHKLKTLAKHFQLPPFKHHDARDDARACAEIFLRLQDAGQPRSPDSGHEFEALAEAILEDGIVDYKEAYQLMYWLEDHRGESADMDRMLSLVRSTLEDDILDDIEADAIQATLRLALHNRRK